MIHLGQYNTLKILRFTPPGAYLGDDEENVVLLPNKYLTEDLEVDQEITVFIYLDTHERIVATTLHPYIHLNTFNYLKVHSTSPFGAFLDWGLEKHLFVPFKEQLVKMEVGKYYCVYLYIDDATQRLVASARIKRHLETERIVVKEGDEVDLLVCESTDLGKNVIINDTYSGLVYTNHLVKNVQRGERCKGYITKVREDGKMDVSLEKPGFQKIEPNMQAILNYLNLHHGTMFLTDKSHPDEIRDELGMSKKTFKQVLGQLYKAKKVDLHEDKVVLVK
jgi:predicted RNA-binding protein (virulence factor B family)